MPERILEIFSDNPIVAETMSKVAMVSVVISLILALLQCFLGYKMLRGWIAVIGFIAGFFLGLVVAKRLGAPGYVPLIAAIIAGILVSIVAFKIYLLGVFLYCGFLAASATGLIPYPEGKGWAVAAVLIGIAAFIAAGILAVKFAKPCIIGITAVSGASTAAQAIAKLSPEAAEKTAMVFIGLVAAGVLVQILMNRGK